MSAESTNECCCNTTSGNSQKITEDVSSRYEIRTILRASLGVGIKRSAVGTMNHLATRALATIRLEDTGIELEVNPTH